MDRKLLQLIGLCQRAGRLVSGETGVLNAIRSNEAELIIIAEDASDNTKKKFTNSVTFYQKQMVIVGDKYELGRAIGKEERSILAVTDSGFAKKIAELIDERQ